MEIIREERTYEGIHAIPSLVMAAMESSGIRRHIDDLCGSGKGCFLSPGMAVKAMVGTMVERGKRPLYRVSDYYSTAPTDRLFGDLVNNNSLSDTVLADRLDDIFALDAEQVLLDCYGKLRDMYGFSSDRLFMDATNYTMFGKKYVETQFSHDTRLMEKGITVKDAPIPAFGGNPKDGHSDRVQMNLAHVVDANGIPMFSKSYDGNTSDVRMNEDMIAFLMKAVDIQSMILMADCKLCTEDILSHLMSSGMPFVTKVPMNFNGRLKETVISSARDGTMDESVTRPGRRYYQTTDTVDGRRVRVITYILPGAESKARGFIEGTGLRNTEKRLRSLKGRRFFCEDDAMDAFRQTIEGLGADCYTADPVVYKDPAAEKRHKDGKLFRVRSENIRIDGSKIRDAISSHATQVLITNLPFSDIPSEDKRVKASADDVIDLYLEQYKAEAGFKMMKSGMDIADVYIHTPSRISAVAFVVSLATMICKALDHVLKETKPPDERRRTIKVLADMHMNTLVKYDRRHDRLSIIGNPGATQDIFGLMERLQIDPQHLLGY